MVLETDMKLCVTTKFFSKISFAVKMGKMGQKKKKPKQGFFNLLEDLIINFFWICSVMKIYIICYVPVQIPYLEKI